MNPPWECGLINLINSYLAFSFFHFSTTTLLQSAVSILFCLVQKWQEQAKKDKLKYDEAMKAYKESKANEPNETPEESKPKKKKGSVKELFEKKEDKKKSSPRKSGGGESQKFKSAEFVDTDESSSEEEEKVSYDLFPSFFLWWLLLCVSVYPNGLVFYDIIAKQIGRKVRCKFS